MKKLLIVVLCLACLLGLTACKKEEGEAVFSSKYVDLEVVEDCGTDGMVLVDRNTGVLYLWYKDWDNYGQTLTPLYYADGTLKNIKDFEQQLVGEGRTDHVGLYIT